MTSNISLLESISHDGSFHSSGNGLRQKETLMLALSRAESRFRGNRLKKKAARAWFIMTWLEDINWHSETFDLAKRIQETPGMQDALTRLHEENAERVASIQQAAFVFVRIFGHTVTDGEWQATNGTGLVDELWQLINTLSA